MLSDEECSATETLGMIWTELIHTLRGQWEASAGSSRAAEDRRAEFIRHWGAHFSILYEHFPLFSI